MATSAAFGAMSCARRQAKLRIRCNLGPLHRGGIPRALSLLLLAIAAAAKKEEAQLNLQGRAKSSGKKKHGFVVLSNALSQMLARAAARERRSKITHNSTFADDFVVVGLAV
jgi:hypothetical protein